MNRRNTSMRRRPGPLLPPPSPTLCFPSFLLLQLLLRLSCCPPSLAQQLYENNKQLNCTVTNSSSLLGYTCNGAHPSCTSYLVFRSQTNYQSPIQIGYLLGAEPSNISALNGVTDISPFPLGDMVLVPVPCSCSRGVYQHNASYTINGKEESYFIVANITYQGLSTCQALIVQNPTYPVHNLTVGDPLLVPLRCACPTTRQLADGAKYLVTYLITWGDDVPTIAASFNVSQQSVLDANGLLASQIIFPFTTLLVPLPTEPTRAEVVTPPPPAASPQPEEVPPPSQGGGGKKWAFIGVGVGAAVLLLCAPSIWCVRRRRKKPEPVPEVKRSGEKDDEISWEKRLSAPLVSDEARGAIESMTVYKLEELEKATGCFGEDNRIKGSSVYHGVINGDDAAIKRLKGDVTNEINVLKRINHSNVIRLSGVCLHDGSTYLVYEYAEQGSLSDWLHHDRSLSWRQRVQIANDVADGLSYLHNYTNPPYVHKDLKSSNILLDGEFRAKVANFGLARPVQSWESLRLTSHVVGTQGYMAPEYLEHGLITPNLDVFAFGVVMLELLSGKEAAFPKEGGGKGEMLLSASIQPVLAGEDVRSKLQAFVDPRLRKDYPFDLAFAMAQLAMRCVSHHPASRPDMTEVLVSLAAIYNSTLEWDPSELADSHSTVLPR